MITNHQYLALYPVDPRSKSLIVGTIHPHRHQEFETQFFYGNKNSLWNILAEAFPNEIQRPINLASIRQFLNSKEISVSDTIVQCKRTTNSALDKDLIPIHLNHQLKGQIRDSRISKILFTSGFGKNNAFRLFYKDILGLKITQQIRSNRKVVLPSEILGRSIDLIILYSPAQTANVGLSKSRLYLENAYKFVKSNRPVHDFKVWYYQQMFRL